MRATLLQILETSILISVPLHELNLIASTLNPTPWTHDRAGDKGLASAAELGGHDIWQVSEYRPSEFTFRAWRLGFGIEGFRIKVRKGRADKAHKVYSVAKNRLWIKQQPATAQPPGTNGLWWCDRWYTSQSRTAKRSNIKRTWTVLIVAIIACLDQHAPRLSQRVPVPI